MSLQICESGYFSEAPFISGLHMHLRWTAQERHWERIWYQITKTPFGAGLGRIWPHSFSSVYMNVSQTTSSTDVPYIRGWTCSFINKYKRLQIGFTHEIWKFSKAQRDMLWVCPTSWTICAKYLVFSNGNYECFYLQILWGGEIQSQGITLNALSCILMPGVNRCTRASQPVPHINVRFWTALWGSSVPYFKPTEWL